MGRNTFILITFHRKSLLLKFSLETIQKVDKIVDIHFFENVAIEKKLPVQSNYSQPENFCVECQTKGSRGCKLSFLKIKEKKLSKIDKKRLKSEKIENPSHPFMR